MHVFIDFSLLNLSFLSCHGVVGGGGGEGGGGGGDFFFFKQSGQGPDWGMRAVRDH